jgi:subtilase family serine protease
VIVPDSSLESPFDIGVASHTNHLIRIRPAAAGGQAALSPSDLQSAYAVTPTTLTRPAIAVILAFHNPYAQSDFNAFSDLFGLHREDSSDITDLNNPYLSVIYASGKQPRFNSGWSQESSLDIEWSHAMSPTAKIFLVEAKSNFNSDLLAAVSKAATLPGVAQISMSWGGSEFSSEASPSYENYFTKEGICFFAASGDTGGKIIWPSVSANVVAAGGTTLSMSSGAFSSETGWSGSGGGNSLYVPKPAWQTGIGGRKRSVPDLSSDADPNTGVLVVWNSGTYQFGGTSVSSPCLAGMANTCGVTSSSNDFLARLYNRYSTNVDSSGKPLGTYSNYYRDITSGTAGSFTCGAGWDFVTGVGSPNGTPAFVGP